MVRDILWYKRTQVVSVVNVEIWCLDVSKSNFVLSHKIYFAGRKTSTEEPLNGGSTTKAPSDGDTTTQGNFKTSDDA